MTRPTNFAFALVLLPIACGPSTQTDTGGDTDGSTSSSGSGSSVTVSTTMTTLTTTTASSTTTTTDATTTDATLTDPTTESTSPDSSTGGGGDGCCDVHAGAGCNEDAVEMCVCEASPDCCVFGWEKNCVDVAMNMCAATCMGSEESSSGGGSSESTGGGGEACAEVVEIDLGADEATIDGEWDIIMSMAGEGMVATTNLDPDLMDDDSDNTLTWDVDVPCDDDWYIWVRAYDFGDQDTFFARLDGEPNPAAIFELDCTNGGNGYVWARLNYRDQMDMQCVYTEDPWIATWATGGHTFQLAHRESIAIARIIVTNDDAFVPM